MHFDVCYILNHESQFENFDTEYNKRTILDYFEKLKYFNCGKINLC